MGRGKRSVSELLVGGQKGKLKKKGGEEVYITHVFLMGGEVICVLNP